jgi:hypothetical protein
MIFIKNLFSSQQETEEGGILDFEEMKKANPIKEFDDTVVYGLSDGLDYSKLDRDFRGLERLVKEKKRLFIIHNGKKLFRVERYLLRLLRALKSKGIDFQVVGIPLCYIQDFLDYSYDLKRFLLNREDFSNYHYFEDCRFCRLRKVCPGALPKHEEQVFASFKEHFVAVDYSRLKAKVYKVPKNIDKLRELFKRVEFVNLKLDEQKILLKNKDDKFIHELFLGFAGKKKDKDVFATDLKLDTNDVERLSDRNKYSYRTSDKERTGKKFLSFLVDVEVCDQIVISSKTNISGEIKELLRPDLVGLVESRDYHGVELMKLLSHKLSLFIREYNGVFYVSVDPVALAKATGEE